MALGLAGVVLLVGWQPEPLTSRYDARHRARASPRRSATGSASVYAKRTHARACRASRSRCGSQLAAAHRAGAGAAVRAGARAAHVRWSIANVVALALASTAIAYLIYFRLIADVGPARALTVTFLIPLFGVLWGFLFLGEADRRSNMLVGVRADRSRNVARVWQQSTAMPRGNAASASQTSSAGGPSTWSRRSR